MSARKAQILEALEVQAKAKRYNQLASVRLHPRQLDCIAATLGHNEVCLRAGNRQGKSHTAGYFTAVSLTGRYPKNWPGRRWDRPIRCWAAGESSQAVRDIGQRKLLGTSTADDSQLGSGFIPRDCIVKTMLSHGVAGAYDKVLVRHESGGLSEVTFKSYDQDRSKWQGEGLDLLWCDEEPDEEHYLEGLARLIENRGLALSTFTPLNGNANILPRFAEGNPNRALVAMDIEDALHLKDPKLREELLSTFPAHQRDARLHGLPMLGSGRVFEFPEEAILTEPFEIPPHFALLWGLDFGVSHPFAAVLLAWDRDADVVYIVHTVRMSDALPLQHCAAMKSALRGWGSKVPAAWPQDGTQRKEFEGKLTPLARIYKAHGQRMLDTHAKFPDGSNSTEAGILAMQERFATARLKVFKHLTDWFQEYREYHRKDGQLVKLRDDLMSASRVGIMSLRSAKVVLYDPNNPRASGNGNAQIVAGANSDPYGW